MKFEECIIDLDGQRYIDADFIKCHLIFSGGPPPDLKDCSFQECQFEFKGAALSTAKFLANIAKGDQGGAEFVVTQVLGLCNCSPGWQNRQKLQLAAQLTVL
jgi:hypothetical protein